MQPRGADGDPEVEESGRDPDPPPPCRPGGAGGLYGGRLEAKGGQAHEELRAQQEFKDNVLGIGASAKQPKVGEIWRFTTTQRIFQLFDDHYGRASTSRMGPTKGTWWREETRSCPQLVKILSAPPAAELVEVRGVGETAAWLRGWVRLWDDAGRPLLEPDRF